MYDLSVGIVIMHKKQIWVGKRAGGGSWQMPQGCVDYGETAFQAAERELKEETGIDNVQWLGESEWYLYNFPKTLKLPKRLSSYIGKKQKWFYVLLGSENNITINEEFSEFKWEHPSWIKNNIVEFKKSTYDYVLGKSMLSRFML